MKKILLIMLCIFIFSISKNVIALELQNLEMEYENNPYYFRDFGNYTDSSKLTFYTLNGEIAYCIEPGVHITNSNYIELPINESGLSDEVLKKIELIAYYGYGNFGHDSKNYRMATQELIWKSIRPLEVSLWTGKNKTGELVDISKEKEEILKLVENHEILPSFNEELILSKDIEYEFIDNNNVLENFSIINDNSNLEVLKKENKLYIKSLIPGDYTITLKKEHQDNKVSILYGGMDGNSQKMMKLRTNFKLEQKITIHVLSGKINLKKIDEDLKTNITIGNSSLEGAIYGLFNEKNDLITKITTNELGEGEFTNLGFGNYYIKEISPSYGYLLDSNIYSLLIDENNLEHNLEVYEKLNKKEFTLIKSLEGESNILEGESDITFEIYFKDNKQLYTTITTNKNGIAKVHLPFGDYIIHQKNVKIGYLKADDFILSIDDKKDEYSTILYDKRVGKLEIIKVDSKTKETLSNAFFEIYNTENDSLIYQGFTNENGILSVDNLLYGTYKIVESQAPDGYIIRNKEYIIDINNNVETNFLEIPNDYIEVEVPSTSMDALKSKKYIGIIVFVIGFCFVTLSKFKIITKFF